jgi:2'-5' RNA ligase
MRTFVAIPLPENTKSTLSLMQASLKSTGADVRWASTSSIHMTLKFLGEIDPPALPRLTCCLAAAAAGESPFSLVVGGLGAFPNLRNPRVVWCGLEGELDRLMALQAKVEAGCSKLGFPPEERSFSPHLTLGRVKGSRNLAALGDCIRAGSPLRADLRVEVLNIYKSTLTPSGAIYGVLEQISLTG